MKIINKRAGFVSRPLIITLSKEAAFAREPDLSLNICLRAGPSSSSISRDGTGSGRGKYLILEELFVLALNSAYIALFKAKKSDIG